MPVLTLSLAQRLPCEVLEMVARYMSHERCLGQGVEERLSSGCELLSIKPMLWVCCLWRTAILPIYCRNATITTHMDRRVNYQAKRCLNAVKVCDLGWGTLVKELHLYASERAISTEMLLKELCLVENKLVNVACVRIYLAKTIQEPQGEQLALNGVVDISLVVDKLADMIPGIMALRLSARNLSQVKIAPSTARGRHLLQRKLSAIEVWNTPAPSVGLVSLSLRSLVLDMAGPGSEGLLRLARQVSQTLEELYIKYVSVQDCIHIIQSDDDKSSVVYPQLRRMALDVLGAYDPDEFRNRQAPANKPFPRLEVFECRSMYPFTNNAPLYSCRHTLKKLSLAVDRTIADVLFLRPSTKSCILSMFEQLEFLEIHVITRSTASDEQNRQLHRKILDIAFSAPKLDRLKIRYPNSNCSEYTHKDQKEK